MHAVVSESENPRMRPVWLVGASYGGNNDQTSRFLREGRWENGYFDRYIEDVKSVLPGDRIAIKATYVRRHNLPFDNRRHPVSVMGIKATGTVTENAGDGRNLKVDWTPVDPPREWFFYTYRGTVWRVVPGRWANDELISFVFEGEEQDIDAFRNEDYWKDRFGDQQESNPRPVEIHTDEGTEEQDWPPEPEPEPEIPYSLDDIIREGCFLERSRLETILDRLRSKKNLILQGPPGTGKTWLAKKLAFSLIGVRSERRVRPFQFHPNLSYEDFVRGWRPGGDGRLALVDGPFLTAMEDASREPALNFVVVIEEINRGNPAQIFGEMLTLLEADKRNRHEALALSYPREPNERVHIPPNLFVIGTMNVADRSLALVDLALRRRFAFIDLEPVFGDVWRNWVSEQCGLDTAFLGDIEGRLTSLNQTIAGDNLLGPQFRIGHSVVTPVGGAGIDDPVEWFRQVVETEITPLLDEYWFDQPGRAGEEKDKLLRGLAS